MRLGVEAVAVGESARVTLTSHEEPAGAEKGQKNSRRHLTQIIDGIIPNLSRVQRKPHDCGSETRGSFGSAPRLVGPMH